MNARTQTRTHKHMYTHKCMHTHTRARWLSDSAQGKCNIDTHVLFLSHTHTRSHSHACTHTHTRTHTHPRWRSDSAQGKGNINTHPLTYSLTHPRKRAHARARTNKFLSPDSTAAVLKEIDDINASLAKFNGGRLPVIVLNADRRLHPEDNDTIVEINANGEEVVILDD